MRYTGYVPTDTLIMPAVAPDKQRILITLPRTLAEQLKESAYSARRPRSSHIIHILEEAMGKEEQVAA
jgi:hypothetical protein